MIDRPFCFPIVVDFIYLPSFIDLPDRYLFPGGRLRRYFLASLPSTVPITTQPMTLTCCCQPVHHDRSVLLPEIYYIPSSNDLLRCAYTNAPNPIGDPASHWQGRASSPPSWIETQVKAVAFVGHINDSVSL